MPSRCSKAYACHSEDGPQCSDSTSLCNFKASLCTCLENLGHHENQAPLAEGSEELNKREKDDPTAGPYTFLAREVKIRDSIVPLIGV